LTAETKIDRAARVRRAIVELVAERGIHGTSMSQVAERAGVATGTAYVHYESKENVLIASFVEVKQRLGRAGVEGVESAGQPRAVFEAIWRRIHRCLEDDPAIAAFLVQFEASPLRARAHEALPDDDALSGIADNLADSLVDLPSAVLYDLALAPALRLVASRSELTPGQLDLLVESCWKAVSKE
jgi:AcrR family transcriptional regulator